MSSASRPGVGLAVALDVPAQRVGGAQQRIDELPVGNCPAVARLREQRPP